MSIRALLTPWKHTRGWLPYEMAILTFLAERSGDRTFSETVVRQVESVLEVRRKRAAGDYETWPAFLGGIPRFPTHKTLQTAVIEASHPSGKVLIRVLLGGGMLAKIIVRGEDLPRPPSIVLTDMQLAQFELPVAPVLPEAKGWVADFIRKGLVERLNPPLSEEERTIRLRSLPVLPGGYLEFSEQSEGGVAAPGSEEFDILGVADLSRVKLPDGREFVPLVNMREFGGLAALPREAAVFLVDGDLVETYAPTFQEALRKLAHEYGAA